MNTYIALLRGINVSGYNIIKMADLKLLLTKAGLNNVVTYIQSGNIIFNYKKEKLDFIEKIIATTIKEKYDYNIKVNVFEKSYLQEVFNENPFSNIEEFDPKKVGFTFLKDTPTPENIEKIIAFKTAGEQLIIKSKIVYMFCANGFGKTKITNKNLENKLQTSATTRNLRTVTKLLELSK